LGDDFRVSLTNVPGKESYPISSFTWIDAPAVAKDPQRGRAVAEYMKWFHTTGQKIAQERGYAILPEDVQEKVVSKATTIR
jgi:phosphate transport system substrate-binding protein